MVAQARYEITASDETKAAVASAMRGLDGIGGKVGAVGAAISAVTTGAMAAFAKAQIDNADMMGKLASKINMSTESASAFAYAARYADIDSGQLTQSIKTLSQAQVDAQKPGSEFQQLFDALGVSTKEANGDLRGSEDLLLDLADAFQQLPDGALKTDAAVKLFGRSGIEMLDMLRDGRGGLEAFRKEAEGLGVVIDSKTAEAAAKFNDNIVRLQTSMEGLMNKALPPLLAGLEKINELMGVQAQKPLPLASDWMQEKIKKSQEEIAFLNDELEAMSRWTHGLFAMGAASQGKDISMFRSADDVRADIEAQKQAIAELTAARQKALEAEAKIAEGMKKPDQKKVQDALTRNVSAPYNPETDSAIAAQRKEMVALYTEAYPLAMQTTEQWAQEQKRIAVEWLADHEKQQEAQRMALSQHEYGLLQQVTSEEQSLMTREQRTALAFSNRQMMIEEAASRELITEDRKNALLFALQEQHEKELADMKHAAMQRNLSVASDFFGSFAQLAQQGGEKYFKLWKNLAKAQAIVDTYAGATAAYKALAGIPVVGPALGAAAAAAAIASGMARVVSINKTELGSSSVAPGGAPSSGGVGGAGVPPIVPTANNSAGQGGRNGNVLQVTINGAFSDSTLRNDIIPRIAELVNADDIEIVNINSRNGQDLINAARSQ